MGSKFVIADPGLCIGCQTCMAGCLLKHSAPGDVAKPRLNLITTLTISAWHNCSTMDIRRSMKRSTWVGTN